MSDITTKERIAYTEVLYLLKSIEKEYYDKIPKDIINLFEENSLNFYLYYDENGNLKQSDLTLEILAYLNLEYWSNGEKKKNLIEQYEKNDKKMNEKTDPFRNKTKRNLENYEETTQLIVKKKEKWYMKFINLFRKHKKK